MDTNKRRASVPVNYHLFEPSKDNTTTDRTNKKARHSMVTASFQLTTGTIISKSPYEHDFCAESGEPLFDRVTSILSASSCTELEKCKENNDCRDSVKRAFQRLDPQGNATSDEFLEMTAKAHQTLATTDTIFDEGWIQPGTFSGRRSQCTMSMPDYLLLLMIRPNRIAAATNQELACIFTNRSHLFKEAVTKLDAKQEYTSLHPSPDIANRNRTELKTIVFVTRVYLAMKLCGYENLENVPHSPVSLAGKTSTLQQKISECMQILSALTVSTPSSMRARPTATVTSVSKRSLEDALSLPLDTSDDDEDDNNDEEIDSETQKNVSEVLMIPEKKASAENSTMSYQSVVDFLQTQQAKQVVVKRQMRRYHEMNAQQSQLIIELRKTVQQCQSKMRQYKSINADLVAELASVHQEHSQAQAALRAEVETLRLEKEHLMNEKKSLKDFVNKM